MENPTSNLDQIPVGIYEKALPITMSWEERLTAAVQAGYDFVEIAISFHWGVPRPKPASCLPMATDSHGKRLAGD